MLNELDVQLGGQCFQVFFEFDLYKLHVRNKAYSPMGLGCKKLFILRFVHRKIVLDCTPVVHELPSGFRI
jgi:hypothetical protein